MASTEKEFLLLLLHVLIWFALGQHELIPPDFPVQNISEYSIRYLSMNGSDTEDCLRSQPYPYDGSVQSCGTIRYALTESHELMSFNHSNVILLVLPGRYSYGNVTIRMHNFSNIVVRKLPFSEGEAILSCQKYLDFTYNNFYFRISRYIFLKELVFTQCGPRSPGMATSYSEHIVVADCIYRENLNTGYAAYKCADFLVVNCTFQDNINIPPYNNTGVLDPGDFQYGGGLTVDFYNTSSTGMVKNCVFARNHAQLNVRNQNDSRPKLYIPRGHGGAILTTFDNCRNHTLIIEDTWIYDNTALHNGGGIYISFYNGGYENQVVLRNMHFRNNSCFAAGGAISMNTFEVANDNVLVVEDSVFDGNSAWVGGGACSVNHQDNLMSDESLVITNVASFTSCSFVNNSSPTGGSAVGLISNARVDQALATTNFTDCIFRDNSGDNQSAVLGFRFPISLQGRNTFSGNTGGAVSLLQTRLDAMGHLWFESNQAIEGAGIAMEDQSLLHLFSGVEITFLNNRAETVGGAISVHNPSVGLDVILLFNTRCFIQYEVNTVPDSLDPAEWNVNLYFINNTAGRDGAAIYATDISRCTYAPSLREGSYQYEKSIFNVTPPFSYSGNRVLNATLPRRVQELATAASELIVTPLEVQSAPGQVLEFSVRAVDQSGNWEQAVWSLDSTQGIEEESDVENFFSLPAGGTLHPYPMHAIPPSVYYTSCSSNLLQTLNFSLLQVIAGDVSAVSIVQVNVTCCYPGYYFSDETHSDEAGTCVHDRDNSVIVRPDSKNQYFYLQPEIYAEVREGVGLVTAVMPLPFQQCTRQGALTGCLFKYDHLDEQCANNRTGFLCGRCPEGEGVDLTLIDCKSCSIADAIVVALIVIVLVVISVLVLIFNIGVPNDLKGCVFFVQVVGFVYHNTQAGATDWDFHLSRVFGFSFYLPLCPAPGYNALATAAYGFILPVLAFTTVVLYIISARFIRPLSQRTSFDGIWLLSLFIYKYTADTCFNILRCQKVAGTTGEFVYYYDGSIQCFDPQEHLGLALFALLLVVLVVLLFPVIIFVISFKHFKHTQPFTDVLTNGLKTSCRWWSGFDLLRRLLFVAVVFFINYIDPSYTQLALLLSGLFVFFVFACAQPYQRMRTNIIEAAILLDLLLLTALFLNVEERSRHSTQSLALTLLLLPFIIIPLYILVRVVIHVWKKKSPASFMLFVQTVMMPAQLRHRRKSRGVTLHAHELRRLHSNPTEPNEDVEDSTVLDGEYSAYREELLDEEDASEQ